MKQKVARNINVLFQQLSYLMKRKSFLLAILVFVFLTACNSSSSFRPFSSVDYNPKLISEAYLGDTAVIQATLNHTSPYGGLCWAWTAYDNTKVLLTPECIKQKGIVNLNFYFKLRNIPSYEESIDVKCSFRPVDECIDGYDWSDFRHSNTGRTVAQTIKVKINSNYCGDKKVTNLENCEGNLLNDEICQSLGFSGGVLKCNNSCKFDTSQCYKCGDGNINPGEECDSQNLNQQTCQNLGKSGGILKCNNSCKFDLSGCFYCGDNKVNFVGEECDGSDFKGQSCQTLVPGSTGGRLTCINSCKVDTTSCYKCGNGVIDPGENCFTCQEDVKCASGYACNQNIGQCVQLGTELNCASIGDVCTGYSGDFIEERKECSVDNKKVEKIGYKFKNICIKQGENFKCDKIREPKISKESCEASFCQNGSCGCSDGYSACAPLGKCIKESTQKINEPCSCDFQCGEGYCDSRTDKCTEGLNIKIKSNKKKLNLGDEAEITFSVSNTVDKDITGDILVNVGSGLRIVDVKSGDQCGGSQCKLDRKVIPVGSKKDVIFVVRAESNINTVVDGAVSYSVGNIKNKKVLSSEKLRIIECGNGVQEEGETQNNCCIDTMCPKNDDMYEYTCNSKSLACERSVKRNIKITVSLIVLGVMAFVTALYVILHRPRKPEVKKEAKKKFVNTKCDHCSTEFKPNAKFCHKCGGRK